MGRQSTKTLLSHPEDSTTGEKSKQCNPIYDSYLTLFSSCIFFNKVLSQ